MTATAKCSAGPHGLHAWLAGHWGGRWLTPGSRWLRTVVTAALLVAGVAAWALALVQPWAGKAVDSPLAALMGGPTPGQVRSAGADVSALLAEPPRPAPKVPPRNPFAAVAASEAKTAASAGARDTLPAPHPNDEPSAQEVLDLVKGLRLEVILITPGGERWAVINGRNYREGDAVAGLEIVEIQEGRAKLQRGGMTCLLRMD